MSAPSVPTDTVGLIQRLTSVDLDDAVARDLAYATLVSHIHARLIRLSRKMLNGYPRLRNRHFETEDVLHEAMLDFRKSIEAEPPTDARHLLNKAAQSIRRELSRLARREVRLKRTAPKGNPNGEPIDRDAPDLLAEWTEFHDQVERLEKPYREVVDLRWYQGLTEAETAVVIGVGERAARDRYSKAREKIQRALGGRLPGMPID